MIREATTQDLPEILVIYNHAIVHTTAVYTYDETTLEERQQWFIDKVIAGIPVYVYIHDAKIVGFATYGSFRNWPAYQYTVEHSIYVHPDYQRMGIASRLLKQLEETLIARGYQTVVAGIDSANKGSRELHERHGFTHVGTLKKVGFKFDQWLDLAFYQKQLK
ncbi:GNAT family N-acetyltransferase [Staphylococcus americanisciuri]|uniref:GNAT family N-acetyltransferase n=1 Tax=Staphylococcus americanisciuri TaxID=2973940 RepID=A0ABT2F341_9STAP|nr:GNAT family N-acetyltransferase [Staphylococcus americanisciuri]MCS4486878.1 GNAT family N-acetyltransferase [Staphylococcus americanisciuri]